MNSSPHPRRDAVRDLVRAGQTIINRIEPAPFRGVYAYKPPRSEPMKPLGNLSPLYRTVRRGEDVTAAHFGDPLPGRSALDRMRGRV